MSKKDGQCDYNYDMDNNPHTRCINKGCFLVGEFLTYCGRHRRTAESAYYYARWKELESRHPAASEWKPISEVPLEKWVILNDGESYGCPATPEYFHDEKQKEDFIKRGYKFYAEIYPPQEASDNG